MSAKMDDAFYKSIPKVELHVHLDGTFQLKTLMTMAKERGIPIPDNEQEFLDQVSVSSPTNTLAEFISKFDTGNNIIGGSSKGLAMASYDFCEASHEAGVLYSELKFSPVLCTHSEVAPDNVTLTYDQVMDAVLEGIHRGQKEFGIKVNLIIVSMIHMPERANDLVELALRYRDRGVVAMDIAGDELIPLDQLQMAAIKKAKQSGLHITLHAGEVGPAANVQRAIEKLGAERIGHGYRVLEDEKAYVMAKERAHFEVCPHSSIYTGAQQLNSHAIVRFNYDNVNFSINSDDPSIIRKTLIDDYKMCTELGLSYKRIKQSVFNGIDATFLPHEEKALLRDTVTMKFQELETKYKIDN